MLRGGNGLDSKVKASLYRRCIALEWNDGDE